MKRLIVSIPDEIDVALREISEERGAPLAVLAREAFEDLIRKHGKKIDAPKVKWGRSRKEESEESDQGQTVALAALARR